MNTQKKQPSTKRIIEQRLTEEDYQELSSFLTDEQILKTGHFSFKNASEAKREIGINHRGLAFNYLDTEGDPFKLPDGKTFLRIKPKDWAEDADDPPKYLSPKSAGNRPYFSRLCDWRSVLRKGTLVIITEGEKKADCLCAKGYAAIGLAGVSCWRDSTSRPGETLSEEHSRPLPELKEFDWATRTVIICFDSDVTSKWQVRKQLHELSLQLQEWGAYPKILLLPSEIDGDKNGADDFIIRHGLEAFEKLNKLAFSALIPDKKIWKLNLPSDPSLRIKAAMSESVLKESWRYRPGIGWYEWKNTHWVMNDDGKGLPFESALIEFMDNQGWEEQTNGHLNSLVRQLKAKLKQDSWNAKTLICFSNGTLDTKTNRFFPEHQRHDFLTSLIPYNFDPTAQCPTWLNFLNEALTGEQDTIAILQAFIKWVLVPKDGDRKAEIEKCLDLVGRPGTGKGTTLDVIQALVGVENYGAIGKGTFKGDPTQLANLIDKKVSIDFDASGYVEDVGVFNKIVANEPVKVKRLYRDFFTGRLNTTIIRAYNRFLEVASGSEGLDRRIIAMSFNNQPKAIDLDLSAKLQAELPGIFAWAWNLPDSEMKRRLLWAGQAKNVAETSAKRFEANNPEFSFLSECFPDGKSEVKPRDLYTSYKDWCKETGHQAVKERKFFETIEQMGCDRQTRNGYRCFAIPQMKNFDIVRHLGLSKPLVEGSEKNAPEKNFLAIESHFLTFPCQSVVSGDSISHLDNSISHLGSQTDLSEQVTFEVRNEEVSNPCPERKSEKVTFEAQKVFSEPVFSELEKHHLGKWLEKLPKARTVTILGEKIDLPAEYPGTHGTKQTKEPLKIRSEILAATTQEDWLAIANKYGIKRAAWVWAWLIPSSDRKRLKPIFSGEIKQLTLDSIDARAIEATTATTVENASENVTVAAETVTVEACMNEIKVGDRVYYYRESVEVIENSPEKEMSKVKFQDGESPWIKWFYLRKNQLEIQIGDLIRVRSHRSGCSPTVGKAIQIDERGRVRLEGSVIDHPPSCVETIPEFFERLKPGQTLRAHKHPDHKSLMRSKNRREGTIVKLLQREGVYVAIVETSGGIEPFNLEAVEVVSCP